MLLSKLFGQRVADADPGVMEVMLEMNGHQPLAKRKENRHYSFQKQSHKESFVFVHQMMNLVVFTFMILKGKMPGVQACLQQKKTVLVI
jgi:hypothetical protein